jgi:hypothetical protein
MHTLSELPLMPIEVSCRRCGQPFTPTPEALRKGPPHWWYCDQCRPAKKGDPEIAPDA